MTLVKHELKQGLTSLIIWTVSIAALILVCVLVFPEMAEQADAMGEMFSSLGVFTEAVGMDRLNFGTLPGFYSVECGNILGIGGALFAALIAITILSKEEKDRTAEFLITHPVSRLRIITEKLIAVIIEIIVLNAIVYLTGIISIIIIGENVPWKEFNLMHLSFLLMQIEIASICFGISSFLRKNSMGIGLGLAMMLYFLNIVANITDKAEFLKYITPFGYTEGADIISDGAINSTMVLLGMLYAAIGIAAAYWQYSRKDIH